MWHTNLCTQGICFLLIACLDTEGLMLTLYLSKQWVFPLSMGAQVGGIWRCGIWWVSFFAHTEGHAVETLTYLVESIAFILAVTLILGCSHSCASGVYLYCRREESWSPDGLYRGWNTALLGVKKEAGSRDWSPDRASSLGSLLSLVQ